jgi:hypothetical protein
MSSAPVAVRFSEECWQFLRESELLPAAGRLNAEIRAIIDRATPVEIQRPMRQTQYAAGFLRSQASELLTWLAATHEALQKADRRRQIAATCISDIEEAIKRPDGI